MRSGIDLLPPSKRAELRDKMRAGVAEFYLRWWQGTLDAPPTRAFLQITARACDHLGLDAEAALLRRVLLATLSPSVLVH